MEVLEIHPTADLQLMLFLCFPAWYFCLMVFDPDEMFTILTASFLPGVLCWVRGQGLGCLALPLLLCTALGEIVRYFPSLTSLQVTDFFQLFIQLLPEVGVEERDPGHYSCAVETSQSPAD